MSHCYLGIDHGLTGGLVVLPAYPAETFLAQLPMPTQAARKGREIALAAARQLWPTESFFATPRSTKPHEGLSDAALIAEHARRQAW